MNLLSGRVAQPISALTVVGGLLLVEVADAVLEWRRGTKIEVVLRMWDVCG